MILKLLLIVVILVIGYFLKKLIDLVRPDVNKIYYFKDKQGRVTIYHGVNVCNYSKYSPDFLPWHKDEDYAKLKKWGFNLVRFLIYWEAVEPEKDKYNLDYLKQVAEHIKTIGKYGADVIIDVHQDVYSKKYTGEGFPAWAINDEGKPFKIQKPWGYNYLQPAVQTASKNFWNSTELKDSYIKMLGIVVANLGDIDNVIGIDIMNEPFPKLPRIIHFERNILTEFYSKAVATLALSGFKKYIYFEPWMCTSTGAPTFLNLHTTIGKAVYFPHCYPPFCEGAKKYRAIDKFFFMLGLRIQAKEAQLFKSPLIYGEFALPQIVDGYLQFVRDFITIGERYLTSWAWWAYEMDTYDDTAILDKDKNEKEILSVLSHVYPQKIAGTNPKYSNENDFFRLEYETIDTQDPTIVFVPERYSCSVSSNMLFTQDGTTWLFRNSGVKKAKIEIYCWKKPQE